MGRRLTTAEFVDRARAVHGDRYDYSAATYVQRSTAVDVICPAHGRFSVLPWRHVSRAEGCPDCAETEAAERAQAATNRWVSRARAVHGDRYDYSRTEFRGSERPVMILCAAHGPFLQKAGTHLQGRGCQACGRLAAAAKRKETTGGYTTAEWVEKAIEVHGNRYGYDLVVYQHSKAKVAILCPTHGRFQQNPTQHLVGYGCAACAREPRLTQDDFLQRARAAHGDRFDYSETVFVGVDTKVRILCPTHGSFDQLPDNHWNGSGCPACGLQNTRLDTERFITHARQLHRNRYDYTQSVYITARAKVRIDCPAHGPFFQRPMHHLQGHGCPRCR